MEDPISTTGDPYGSFPFGAVRQALGGEASNRIPPTTTTALIAAAGALIAAGGPLWNLHLYLNGDGSRLATIGLSVLVVAISYLALAVLNDRPSEIIRPAALAIVGGGIVGLAGGLLATPSGASAVVVILATGAWLAPGTRGRPLLLGLALAAFWYTIVGDGVELGAGTWAFVNEGYASILVGSIYLAAMYRLDTRGLSGALATPFAAVGLVAFSAGTSTLPALELNPKLGTIVGLGGLGMALAGAAGGRRMTTWVGAGTLAIGLVTWVFTWATWLSYSMDEWEFSWAPQMRNSPIPFGVGLCVIGLILAATVLAHSKWARRGGRLERTSEAVEQAPTPGAGSGEPGLTSDPEPNP